MTCLKSLIIRWPGHAQGKLTISKQSHVQTFLSTYGKIGCAWSVAAIAFVAVCLIFFQRQIQNGIEAFRWQTRRSYGEIHLWYLRRKRKLSGQTEEVGSFIKASGFSQEPFREIIPPYHMADEKLVKAMMRMNDLFNAGYRLDPTIYGDRDLRALI